MEESLEQRTKRACDRLLDGLSDTDSAWPDYALLVNSDEYTCSPWVAVENENGSAEVTIIRDRLWLRNFRVVGVVNPRCVAIELTASIPLVEHPDDTGELMLVCAMNQGRSVDIYSQDLPQQDVLVTDASVGRGTRQAIVSKIARFLGHISIDELLETLHYAAAENLLDALSDAG